MPRPNAPRAVYAEDNLAARIASEREQRGWSMEGLARRMTDVGCPINQSAIYKIEQSQPRRRITVDELVGFSQVFDLSLDDLLGDPALAASRRLAPLMDEWRRNYARRIEAVRKCDDRNAEIEGEVQAIAKDNGLAVSVVRDYWADVFPGSHWADDVPELHFLPTSEA